MKQKSLKQIELEGEVETIIFHTIALTNDEFESHRKMSLSIILEFADFVGIDNMNRILSEFSSDDCEIIYMNGELHEIYKGDMKTITEKEKTRGTLYKPRLDNMCNLFKQLDIPIRYNLDFAIDYTLKYLGGIE